jgi:hypothetical protein
LKLNMRALLVLVLLSVLFLFAVPSVVAVDCCDPALGGADCSFGLDCVLVQGSVCSSGGYCGSLVGVNSCVGGACCNSVMNYVLPSTVICDAALGLCETDAVCDGVSNTCPSKTFYDSSTVCRSSTGTCDPEEFCTGVSFDCPGNTNYCPGVECTGGDCCDTATSTFLPRGTQCAAGSVLMCGQPGLCTGDSTICPSNIPETGSSTCTSCIVGEDDSWCGAGVNTFSGYSLVCSRPAERRDYILGPECASPGGPAGNCVAWDCSAPMLIWARSVCDWSVGEHAYWDGNRYECAPHNCAFFDKVWDADRGVCVCDASQGYDALGAGCMLVQCNAAHVGKDGCNPGTVVDSGYACDAGVCRQVLSCGPSTVGVDCSLLPDPLIAGHYCSRGFTEQLPAPGFCCPVESWYDPGTGLCIPTEECRDISPDYCGPVAENLPAQISSFVSNPICIGSAAVGLKPAGMSACCPIPGGKFGHPTYYDWTDASGNLRGVVVY